MRQELIDTIWNWFSAIWKIWSFSFESLWNAFMSTPLWKILSFIWSMIEYLFFAVKSIFNLIRNVLYAVLDWSVSIFVWLMQTFEDLSFYMWRSASLLLSLFVCVLILIVFQFILRLLFWKFHYWKLSKK